MLIYPTHMPPKKAALLVPKQGINKHMNMENFHAGRVPQFFFSFKSLNEFRVFVTVKFVLWGRSNLLPRMFRSAPLMWSQCSKHAGRCRRLGAGSHVWPLLWTNCGMCKDLREVLECCECGLSQNCQKNYQERKKKKHKYFDGADLCQGNGPVMQWLFKEQALTG